MLESLDTIMEQAAGAALELCDAAKLHAGQIVVVGCSSSEIGGHAIGSDSRPDVGKAVFEALAGVFGSKSIYLAAQCCERLNRAIIIERAAVPQMEIVNVIPQPKAGGSFATAAYQGFADPVAVEGIKADAGLDIGSTLIGMHLKTVAVPLRLKNETVGEAQVVAVRTRPKYIGGPAAIYDEDLM
jgi:uncharacterized protein (TIGR01440 family)